MLVLKYALTALIVVVVSEIARRSDRLGALIAALPLVTILVMLWLYVEKQPSEKISEHARYTFWYVLPTLPMFLLIPALMKRGISFPLALGAGIGLTILLFLLVVRLARLFKTDLLP